MNFIIKYVVYIVIPITLLGSCATSSLKISDSEVMWREVSSQQSDSEIYHSVYLIGDVGGAKIDESTIPLIELKKQLAVDDRIDDATDVVFLGDNIYPVGMPPIGHEDRPTAEHKLNVQLESIRDFDGNVTFVPGNHDWYTYGREGLKRQEDYIENYLSQFGEDFTDYFRPSNGCGSVDVLHIANDIAMVSIDSHWFLTEQEKKYDYSDCDIQTSEQFVAAFRDTMLSLDDKQVMLTMHHPLYTTGKHGGKLNFSSLMFPLTQYKKGMVLPLPFSGVIMGKMRGRISAQDSRSSSYVSYRNKLIPFIENHGNTIVAAGHEHTLQYHKVNNVDYIVSGSGSKRGVVGTEEFTKFAYGEHGYGLVDYYNNGSVWLSFFAESEDKSEFGLVYRAKLK